MSCCSEAVTLSMASLLNPREAAAEPSDATEEGAETETETAAAARASRDEAEDDDMAVATAAATTRAAAAATAAAEGWLRDLAVSGRAGSGGALR